ncbi:MAG TPA: beta-L-arabinofuranosidase domain-containing protein [Verrucomicrobiae bacterium]|nr:beta-L-arabinofuranosidase domain-containing protein [Verrucomicrobiae bacterium]
MPFHRTPGCFVTLAVITAFFSAHAASDKVAPAIPIRAQTFAPKQVVLLEGPCKRAMQRDEKWLLSLEPDRLLSRYRQEAGLTPKARNYGGWEEQGISGHSLGHYLSACAWMYQGTGDQRFLDRLNYIVDELAGCQRANTNGFLGAMPNSKRLFAEIARGDIRSAGFDLNGSWVPWYNLHKLLAGLIDAYRYGDNPRALEVATRFGDWVDETTKSLTEAQWQRMLACEFGGMNESLADLYALTGNKKYLNLALKFYHQAILDPLAAGRDELPGKHANTQIPKLIGAARLYELTGDSRHGNAARNFYSIVLSNHTYVTGGNSQGEHFGPARKLDNRLGASTAETCNTYNMLKLSRALFTFEPRAALGDYYERALFNHILASQHPGDGRVTYFLTLKPGEAKKFLGPEDFTCCNGSGMENHARYGEAIYFHAPDQLWVNQFIASELNWTEQGLRLRQETAFPYDAATKLTITVAKPLKLALHIRQPFWATNGFAVMLNGKEADDAGKMEGYVTIEREWKTGDTVDVEMPFCLRTEAMPDNPNRIAIFDGPILLAGNVGAVGSENPVPVFVADGRAVTDWVKPVAGKPLSYRTEGVGRPVDVELKPFFATYDQRHSVYWEVFTEDGWKVREQEYRAEQQRLKELEANSADLFHIGEMQAERDHNVHGEKTGAGEYNGRKLRHAWDGGWFSFEVAVATNAPSDLVITYWGSETGQRTFDVLVEGEKLATTSLHQDQPEQFWDKVYPLPETLTRGKQKVTVKFQAHPGNFAGGVFGVRVVKRQ